MCQQISKHRRVCTYTHMQKRTHRPLYCAWLNQHSHSHSQNSLKGHQNIWTDTERDEIEFLHTKTNISNKNGFVTLLEDNANHLYVGYNKTTEKKNNWLTSEYILIYLIWTAYLLTRKGKSVLHCMNLKRYNKLTVYSKATHLNDLPQWSSRGEGYIQQV